MRLTYPDEPFGSPVPSHPRPRISRLTALAGINTEASLDDRGAGGLPEVDSSHEELSTTSATIDGCLDLMANVDRRRVRRARDAAQMRGLRERSSGPLRMLRVCSEMETRQAQAAVERDT